MKSSIINIINNGIIMKNDINKLNIKLKESEKEFITICESNRTLINNSILYLFNSREDSIFFKEVDSNMIDTFKEHLDKDYYIFLKILLLGNFYGKDSKTISADMNIPYKKVCDIKNIVRWLISHNREQKESK